MTWRTDERTRRSFGAYSMVSQTLEGETAHLIEFPDGVSLRVLPDDVSTGQRRSKVVRSALERCAAVMPKFTALIEGEDARAYVRGAVAGAGLTWEQAGPADPEVCETCGRPLEGRSDAT